jgi:translocation and assembly module TamB
MDSGDSSSQRLLARLAGSLLAALLLAGAVALWWAGQTTWFVRWALAQAVAASDGSLEVGRVRGTLAGGFGIEWVRWRDGARDVELRGVRIAARPLHLLQGQLRLARVEIAEASVRLLGQQDEGPAGLPASLRLPIDLRLDALGLGHLRIAAADAEAFELERLALSGRYRAGAYRVEHLSMRSPRWGEVSLDAVVGDRAPFALEVVGRLVPRIEGWGALPQIGVLADGSLEDFEVVAQALAPAGAAAPDPSQLPRPVWIGLETRVRPFAPTMPERLAPVELSFHEVEPAQLGMAQAPRARVTGSATMRLEEDGVAGRVALRNALPGPADQQAIPVSAAETAFGWSGSRLALADLRITPAGGGALTGDVAIDFANRLVLPGHALPASTLRLALHDVDLSQLWSALEPTRLRGQASLDDSALALEVSDARRQGITASARAQVEGERLRVERAQLRTSAGTLSARGTTSLAAPWRIDLSGEFGELDPARVAAVQAALAGTRTSAVPDAAQAWLSRFPGSVGGHWSARGEAWPDPLLDARIVVDRGQLDRQSLRADVRARVSPQRIADAVLALAHGDLRASAQGSFGHAGDRLRFSLQAGSLARFDGRLDGSLSVNGELTGGWSGLVERPRGEASTVPLGIVADIDGKRLRWTDALRVGALTGRIELPDLHAGRVLLRLDATALESSDRRLERVRVHADGEVAAHALSIEVSGRDLAGRAAAHGALSQAPAWRWEGRLDELALEAPVPVRLESSAALAVDAHGAALGEATVQMDDGVVRIANASWREGRLETRGEASGLPVARWTERFAGPQALAGVEGELKDVRLHGQWDLVASSPRSPSGRLELRLEAGEAIEGRGKAVLAFDEGRIDGAIDVRIPTLAFANRLIGPEWHAAGRLRFAGNVGGTVEQPRLQGALTGRNLALVQRALGWRLTNGTLRARFDGDRLDLEQLRLESGGGSITMAGQLLLDGMYGGFTLHAERLPVPIGPGQRVVVSGDTGVASSGTHFEWQGVIRADEGLIELRGGEAPRLPDDVVIAGVEDTRAAASAAGAGDTGGFRIGADLDLDLGRKLRVRGSGVDVVLEGVLNLRGTLPAAPRAFGTVRVREGTYSAYGQTLEITRGQVVFNGPLDNPVLDIVAMRRNQAVEAGVALSGTVLSPRLRLVSTPDVPDAQKLSWLVLGVGLDDVSTGGQTAALQAAAATLFGSNDGGLSGELTRTLGLDMLTVRGASTGGVFDPNFGATFPGQASSGGAPIGTAAENVVAIGKRLSSRVFVTYEQGLRGVWNLLRIQYDITNRLAVRAQAGTESGVDVLYFYSFD